MKYFYDDFIFIHSTKLTNTFFISKGDTLIFDGKRMNEQVNAPVNDRITFTYPWILELPPPETDVEEPHIDYSQTMVTSYNVASLKWELHLSSRHVLVYTSKNYVWNASCKVSYKIFIDNDMQVEIFSSTRTSTIASQNFVTFITPDGFLEEFYDLFKQRNVAKIVILVELSLPMKNFNRPFELPLHHMNKKHCNEYPEDMEKNFRFEFLKDGDYFIKCRDGSVPALRMVLNVSSKLMMKHLKESKDVEIVVEHSVDAVKPVITYLHSLCFEMPKSYDLDFADRLFMAVDFFQPEKWYFDIHQSIELSLCRKFVEENHDFDSLLKWLTVARRHHCTDLSAMICALISNKFYFKWIETFPENARNVENPFYRDVFGSRCYNCFDEEDLVKHIFSSIEYTFMSSLSTNIILP